MIQEAIIGGKKGKIRIITAEAGIRTGWEGWTSSSDDNFSINRFGESGPGNKVATRFGFTADKLAELIKR